MHQKALDLPCAERLPDRSWQESVSCSSLHHEAIDTIWCREISLKVETDAVERAGVFQDHRKGTATHEVVLQGELKSYLQERLPDPLGMKEIETCSTICAAAWP